MKLYMTLKTFLIFSHLCCIAFTVVVLTRSVLSKL